MIANLTFFVEVADSLCKKALAKESATGVQFPLQVKPKALEAKVLTRRLKERTDCRKASWHASHPGSGLQDIGHGFPRLHDFGHGVRGKLWPEPKPSRDLQNLVEEDKAEEV